MPVRFEPDDLKLITAAARIADKTVSEWIRGALRTAADSQIEAQEAWTVISAQNFLLRQMSPDYG